MSSSAKRKRSRELMLEAQRGKDRPRCSYCGAVLSRRPRQQHGIGVRPFTMDHIIPKADGGMLTRHNLLPACEPCNFRRGDRPLDQFIASLGDEAVMTVEQAREHMDRATRKMRWR